MTSKARLASVRDLPPQAVAGAAVQSAVTTWSWETDASLQLEFLCPNTSAGLGYRPEELHGARLESLAATTADAARLMAFLNGRLPFRDLDLLLAQRDGTPGLFRLSGTPVFCPNSGEFLGFRGEGRDLADPAVREATLRRLVEATEAANRAKRDFIANMSHELRTPLNAIIGFSEMMAQQAFGPLGDERYRDYAALTLESANHLLRLISDLLDVAKIEAGKLELEESELDPADLLRSVQRVASESRGSAGPTLTAEIPFDLPLLYADERKLRQVLLNLLSNATKFTPSEGRVHLTARREADGAVTFVVEDSGIGIAPEDFATAFAPFGQIKHETSRCVEGSGLGLPLSKALAELHGGALDLASQPGQGSVVRLRLPAWRCLPRR